MAGRQPPPGPPIAGRSIRLREPAFLLVKNRLEGNAPSTIEAVADTISAP